MWACQGTSFFLENRDAPSSQLPSEARVPSASHLHSWHLKVTVISDSCAKSENWSLRVFLAPPMHQVRTVEGGEEGR